MVRSINLTQEEKRLEEARKSFEEKKKKLSFYVGKEMLETFGFKSTTDFDKWLKKLKQREAGFE